MLELLRIQNNLNIRFPCNLNLMNKKIIAISLQLKVDHKQTLYLILVRLSPAGLQRASAGDK